MNQIEISCNEASIQSHSNTKSNVTLYGVDIEEVLDTVKEYTIDYVVRQFDSKKIVEQLRFGDVIDDLGGNAEVLEYIGWDNVKEHFHDEFISYMTNNKKDILEGLGWEATKEYFADKIEHEVEQRKNG